MSKKRSSLKRTPPPVKAVITQQKRDQIASILAIMIGLLSIREGGSVLLGLTVPDFPVLTWLVWYNVALGFVSVAAGVGIWTGRHWGYTLPLNILALHAVVFIGLVALYKLGQTVAMRSIFAMMLRTFTWIVIFSLVKWKRQEER